MEPNNRDPLIARSSPGLSRRRMLELSGMGLGSLALSYLLGAEGLCASEQPETELSLRTRPPHFAPKAKSVILMMQNGGPSQMDLFDPKSDLQKYDGKQHSFKVDMFQPGSEQNKLMGCPFQFQHVGRSGMEMSDVIPHLGSVADEFCHVRSMHSEHNNHTTALIMFMTGKIFQGRPSFGSWISYALGTENQNLPAYVVLRDPTGYNTSGTLTWDAGWLPALYRGTEFSSQGAPVLNLRAQPPRSRNAQGRSLSFLAELNRLHQENHPGESELETRIQNYELAARMQLATDEVLDISKESEHTRGLYGLDNDQTRSYGIRCLMARKLVESGVRFVQIHPKPFQPWDTHSKTKESLKEICGNTDLPSAGLILDLKQRGLLEETIVIWAGEFGRLPVSQNGTGRDHNRHAFSILVAGGGFKSAYIHGRTDDIGYKAVEGRVSVPDLHATILHQLGLDHERLAFRHSGRDETLTDASLTAARVVHDLLDA